MEKFLQISFFFNESHFYECFRMAQSLSDDTIKHKTLANIICLYGFYYHFGAILKSENLLLPSEMAQA
jgi:hypothetical protein